MGQYLAIGLSTKISVNRAELEATKWSFEYLVEQMSGKLALSLDNYHLEARPDEWLWTLRPELLAAELIPLLEALYPALYPLPDPDNDSEAVLRGLRERDPGEWMEWANRKPHYLFQDDPYGTSDYLRADFGRRVGIHYRDLALSMEGKILMEEYGRQFRFFQQCLAHRFGDFALARSLRVYITG